MSNRKFTVVYVVVSSALLLFATMWLLQNIEMQNSIIDGNEQNSIIIQNQVEIKKILDERTPMILDIQKRVDKIENDLNSN